MYIVKLYNEYYICFNIKHLDDFVCFLDSIYMKVDMLHIKYNNVMATHDYEKFGFYI